MLFWVIFKVSIKSLFANKLRSFLAMLGIIIGVGSVISMLSIGAGAQREILAEISGLKKNLFYISPVWISKNGSGGRAVTLKIEDGEEIFKRKEIKMINLSVYGNFTVKYLNKNTDTQIIGTTLTYFTLNQQTVEKGRMFKESEMESDSKVAVLGTAVIKNLFKNDEPIGQIININRINFKVIGILKEKGASSFNNPDDIIIIPYRTAMKQLLGTRNLQNIEVLVEDGTNPKQIERNIEKILRKRHKLNDNEENDFRIQSATEIIERVSRFTNIFNALLGGIGSISLLVGGIGIMNIMLVTVTERTREIGIRKAIGAKNRDILTQFLIESTIMSLSGGTFGILFGSCIVIIINNFLPFKALVTLNSVAISFLFCIAVGIFFGFYPARQASKLNTIDALRYE